MGAGERPNEQREKPRLGKQASPKVHSKKKLCTEAQAQKKKQKKNKCPKRKEPSERAKQTKKTRDKKNKRGAEAKENLPELGQEQYAKGTKRKHIKKKP